MITRPQQILLKRAQSEAGLPDEEYRDALELVTALPGCRSSKDARLTDEHVDSLLSYFEAIYWHKVDTNSGELQAGCKRVAAVFRHRGFWASRNRNGNTSRDRYTVREMQREAAWLESRLQGLGYGVEYLESIQRKIAPFDVRIYVAALRRTLASKAG